MTQSRFPKNEPGKKEQLIHQIGFPPISDFLPLRKIWKFLFFFLLFFGGDLGKIPRGIRFPRNSRISKSRSPENRKRKKKKNWDFYQFRPFFLYFPRRISLSERWNFRGGEGDEIHVPSSSVRYPSIKKQSEKDILVRKTDFSPPKFYIFDNSRLFIRNFKTLMAVIILFFSRANDTESRETPNFYFFPPFPCIFCYLTRTWNSPKFQP